MNRKVGMGAAAAAAAAVAIAVALAAPLGGQDPGSDPAAGKVGLVINTPSTEVSLATLDKVYADAASTGIGRSNVYMFWNLLEPNEGEYDWGQPDILMGLNEKNGLKVTLYFSVINGDTLGPFPAWMGSPDISEIGQDRLARTLDAILSRYHIVDAVVISGETESQFRYDARAIPEYRELFTGVAGQLKEKHPDVKFGNSFGLHHVLNKGLENIVDELAVGDFVAFSYFPVDSLNDIVKEPGGAAADLEAALGMVPGKRAALFEVGWATSGFVGGDETSQAEFVGEVFDFYERNEPDLEFVTWYRQYDRPEGTCKVGAQQDGAGVQVGGNEHVRERLGHYLCSSGLVGADQTPKPGWAELQGRIGASR